MSICEEKNISLILGRLLRHWVGTLRGVWQHTTNCVLWKQTHRNVWSRIKKFAHRTKKLLLCWIDFFKETIGWRKYGAGRKSHLNFYFSMMNKVRNTNCHIYDEPSNILHSFRGRVEQFRLKHFDGVESEVDQWGLGNK